MRVPTVYKDAPQFGFDLGSHTAKLVQLRRSGGGTSVLGYGYCYFPRDAISEGIVADPEAIAAPVKALLAKLPYGKITAKRVVAGLPATKMFTRTLQLPPMSAADLKQAVRYEIEQYVPVPIADLYTDYEIVGTGGKDGQTDVLMVAAPRAIVDSYIKLFDVLGLEVGSIEATMTSVVRALLHSGDAGASSLVLDLGSIATDFTIYDKFIPITGSAPVGGDQFTDALVAQLGVKTDQANEIKAKFGIGKSGMHDKVVAALDPSLQATVKEAKRLIKYYQDRSGKDNVASVVLAGGGAAMPGLDAYLRTELGLPLTVASPWKNLARNKNATDDDANLYASAIGLALRGLL